MENGQTASQLPAPEQWHPAGFWVRFLADVVDSLVIYYPVPAAVDVIAMCGLLSHPFALFVVKVISVLVLGGIYYTVLTGRSGQTWGKKALDIKVVNQDGTALTYSTAFGRWCAYLPSYLTLGIGFMMAGWNPEKKALHDYFAGTRVIRKGPATSARRSWKFFGAIAAVGAVLLSLAAAGVVLWLRHGREEYLRQLPAIEAEAKAFGQKTDQEGCVKEVFSQTTGGLQAQVRRRAFLEKCLVASRPSERFCEEVPAKTSYIASGGWKLRACEKFGRRGDPTCSMLVEGIQTYCEAPRPPLAPQAPAKAGSAAGRP
jgi:uncharacterized RDD family membrane protein YckC